MQYEHETQNLRLDSDGDVWLIFYGEDGERDWKHIGHVERCGLSIPSAFNSQYEELEQVWEQWGRESNA